MNLVFSFTNFHELKNTQQIFLRNNTLLAKLIEISLESVESKLDRRPPLKLYPKHESFGLFTKGVLTKFSISFLLI